MMRRTKDMEEGAAGLHPPLRRGRVHLCHSGNTASAIERSWINKSVEARFWPWFAPFSAQKALTLFKEFLARSPTESNT